MDIRRALTFLFADPHWRRKLLVATVLSVPSSVLGASAQFQVQDLVPLGLGMSPLWGQIARFTSIPVLGYVLRITRSVLDGSDVPLPAWSDVGGILRNGFQLWVVITLWSLPADLASYGRDETSAAGPGVVQLITTIAFLVASYATLVVEPAAEARLAATGSLAAGLDVRTAFARVHRHLTIYLRLVGYMLVGFLAGLALCLIVVTIGWRLVGGAPSLRNTLSAAFVVGLLTLRPYGLVVLYHLYGQAYVSASALAPTVSAGEPDEARVVRTARRRGPVRRVAARRKGPK